MAERRALWQPSTGVAPAAAFVAALIVALAAPAGVVAQTPLPAPSERPEQDPKPEPKPDPKPEQDPKQDPKPQSGGEPAAPKPEPIDPTRAAAEILRKRLGLGEGPIGPIPKGPPVPGPRAAEIAPERPEQEPEPLPRASGPQSPGQPLPGQEPAIDPTRAAARALERLLPRARPPGSGPVPDRLGTPEPVLRDGATPPPPRARIAETGPRRLRGTLATRYRWRHGAGFTDQDLVTRLNFVVGDEATDPVTFHFQGYGFADLDGRRTDDPFRGLDQSFGDELNARLYAAHVDVRDQVPGLALVRIGRQDLALTPVFVNFDGLRVDSARFGGALRAFVSAVAGIPVHQFESSARGDSVYGAAFELQPWRGSRMRFDWLSLRDEFLALDRHDELLAVRWWQQLQDVRLRGNHTWVDGRGRDLELGADAELPFALLLDVDYRELLTTQRAQVNELDPYFAIAAEYRPYRQLGVTLSRDFGDDADVTLAAGADVRRLADRSDEARFNREFQRVWAEGSWNDAFAVPGLTAVLTGSLWDGSGEATRALTGSLSYRATDDVRVEFGSAYDLFRYDSLADRERLHVRSFYLRCDWRLDGGLRADSAYEYERNDDDEFHLLRVGMTWTF